MRKAQSKRVTRAEGGRIGDELGREIHLTHYTQSSWEGGVGGAVCAEVCFGGSCLLL